MKKTFLLALAMLSLVCNLQANDYSTPGDGKAYSFETLAGIAESGVSITDGAYVVNGTVTIALGDEFVIDNGATVLFADAAELVVKGKADLRAATPTLLGRLGESTSCYGLNIQSEEVTEVSNLTFE